MGEDEGELRQPDVNLSPFGKLSLPSTSSCHAPGGDSSTLFNFKSLLIVRV